VGFSLGAIWLLFGSGRGRGSRAAPRRHGWGRSAGTAARWALLPRLAEALGRTLTLEIREDPELIAGLELDATNAIVRNHFRADLSRITAELTRHD